MPEPLDDHTIPRFPIRLVALRTGLTPHVLRAWERRYDVVRPARTDAGQRLYSELDVERLQLLRRLTDRGHAISRIASLPLAQLSRLNEETPGPDDGAAVSTGSGVSGDDAKQIRAVRVAQAIESALRATRMLDAPELDAVLDRAAVTLGIPVFIDEVVAPLLVRLGGGWARGQVSVAQEHMATAVFRRVLGWLLQVNEAGGTAPRLVAATPPGQAHELGALMAAVSAAAEGWWVTYLGPDLPVADLVRAVAQTGARAVAVSAPYAPEGADLVASLRDMRAGLPQSVALLVGGAATRGIVAQVEGVGARVIASLPEFRAVLRGLRAEQVA